eukprot:COSAG02_NODE_30081_length_557_cov_1.497817_1_plen_35_part_10
MVVTSGISTVSYSQLGRLQVEIQTRQRRRDLQPSY